MPVKKLLRELLNNYQLQYKVVRRDDNPQKHGWSIHSVRVLGSVADIAAITKKQGNGIIYSYSFSNRFTVKKYRRCLYGVQNVV